MGMSLLAVVARRRIRDIYSVTLESRICTCQYLGAVMPYDMHLPPKYRREKIEMAT